MPPPEGLGLIVQKQLADNEARDRNRERAEGGRWRFGMDEDDAMATGRSMGSMAKVERDGAGNVVWDPKYAIIGGIVVAIFVGIVAAWIYAQVKTGASSFTPPTSLR